LGIELSGGDSAKVSFRNKWRFGWKTDRKSVALFCDLVSSIPTRIYIEKQNSQNQQKIYSHTIKIGMNMILIFSGGKALGGKSNFPSNTFCAITLNCWIFLGWKGVKKLI